MRSSTFRTTTTGVLATPSCISWTHNRKTFTILNERHYTPRKCFENTDSPT